LPVPPREQPPHNRLVILREHSVLLIHFSPSSKVTAGLSETENLCAEFRNPAWLRCVTCDGSNRKEPLPMSVPGCSRSL
jgi:hypothetical protein